MTFLDTWGLHPSSVRGVGGRPHFPLFIWPVATGWLFLSWWHDRWWLGRSGWLVVMVGGLTHGWLVVIGNGSWYTVWSVREIRVWL